jgi:hypothetical protein
MPLAVAELIYTGFFVEQAGLPDNSPAGMPPGLPFRFLTFLAGRSFVFTRPLPSKQESLMSRVE